MSVSEVVDVQGMCGSGTGVVARRVVEWWSIRNVNRSNVVVLWKRKYKVPTFLMSCVEKWAGVCLGGRGEGGMS